MDGFLFDLDGLLVDSEPMHYEAFSNTAKKFGCVIPWDFHAYCVKAHTQSMGLKKAFLELFPEKETVWHDLYHQTKLYFTNLVKQNPLPLMPGVETFLNMLIAHDKKLAVVTNSSTSMVLSIIEKQPLLEKIPLWITREDYVNAKPEPDGYLKALDILSLNKENTCGFEDSPRGMRALKAAGVRAFNIHTFPQDNVEGFKSFEEMLAKKSLIETFLN